MCVSDTRDSSSVSPDAAIALEREVTGRDSCRAGLLLPIYAAFLKRYISRTEALLFFLISRTWTMGNSSEVTLDPQLANCAQGTRDYNSALSDSLGEGGRQREMILMQPAN